MDSVTFFTVSLGHFQFDLIILRVASYNWLRGAVLNRLITKVNVLFIFLCICVICSFLMTTIFPINFLVLYSFVPLSLRIIIQKSFYSLHNTIPFFSWFQFLGFWVDLILRFRLTFLRHLTLIILRRPMLLTFLVWRLKFCVICFALFVCSWRRQLAAEI